MSNFDTLDFLQSKIRIVTSEDDLPPPMEDVIFFIPVRTAIWDGTFTENLETYVWYLSAEEYRIDWPIYVSERYEDSSWKEQFEAIDTGWTVEIWTFWLPITNID